MTLANTPPGIRLSSPREAIPFLASFQQVGLPAVAASDAQLGHSVYSYQSGAVAFGQCGADKHVLWRAGDQHSRAHRQTGSKSLVTRRAKVGLRPRWSPVAHVAVPVFYSSGVHYPPKGVATQLRQAFGPSGPRRYSASQYVAEDR